MTEELTKPQNFQERLMARIKESIGELITDEELKKIIESGVNQAFFASKPQLDNWGRTVKEGESFIQRVVRELLDERMKKAVNDWCAENNDKLVGAVDEAIKLGVGKCMLMAIDNRMQSALVQLRCDIENNLRP